MSVTFSSYYDLVRIREVGPETKDWAVTDKNFEDISLILKAFEQHVHNGAVGMLGPTPGSDTNIYDITSTTITKHTGSWDTALFPVGSTITFNGTLAGEVGSITGAVMTVADMALSTGTSISGVVIPAIPLLTEGSTGGSLTPGVTVGVRLSYLNAAGLETNATPEQDITLGLAIQAPDAPLLTSVDADPGCLTGGTYIYVMTKANASGETTSSSALPVTVPYDQTYSVTINWDTPISALTDGTTTYDIYRSAGLNSTFQLVGQITSTSAVTFTDTNVSVDQTQQPPSVSTFDQIKKVTINWSALKSVYPSGAVTMNVYVTQQPGVWSTQNLLTQIDLTGSPPTSTIYLGSETLNVGYPFDIGQIPNAPQKVNLATEATGGFILTADGDFQQHQAKDMVFDVRSSAPSGPINGQVYYDTSIPDVRAYINGSWTRWGAISGSGYTHPAQEAGGHLATNIRWVSGSGFPSVGSMLTRFFDTSGSPTPALPTNSSILSASTSTNSTTPVVAMFCAAPPRPATSFGMEVVFSGNLVVSGSGIVFLKGYWNDGTLAVIPGMFREFVTAGSFGQPIHISAPYYPGTTLGANIDFYFWTSTSACTVTISPDSILYVKVIG